MGMFDWYIPDPPLACPLCGTVLSHWQGKDGSNALAVWRQGVAAPVDQAVDDDIKADVEFRNTWRLPEEFEIYTRCSGDGWEAEAWCSAPDGVWSRTVLETAENSSQRKDERQDQFEERLRRLRGPRSVRRDEP